MLNYGPPNWEVYVPSASFPNHRDLTCTCGFADERGHHIIFDSPMFSSLRLRILGNWTLDLLNALSILKKVVAIFGNFIRLKLRRRCNLSNKHLFPFSLHYSIVVESHFQNICFRHLNEIQLNFRSRWFTNIFFLKVNRGNLLVKSNTRIIHILRSCVNYYKQSTAYTVLLLLTKSYSTSRINIF